MSTPSTSDKVTVLLSAGYNSSPPSWWSRNRYWPHALAIFLLVVLVYTTTLWWLRRSVGFPVLQHGGYWGELIVPQIEFPKFYLERSDKDFRVLLLDRGGSAVQTIPHVSQEVALKFDYKPYQLELVGNSLAGHYVGPVVVKEKGKTIAKGRWVVTVIEEVKDTFDSAETAKYQAIYLELSKVRARQRELALLSSGGEVSALDPSREQLKQELQGKAEEYRLREQATNRGRIVSLGREVLARDAIWAELALIKSQTDPSASDDSEDISQGRQIAELQQEILKNKQEIRILLRELQDRGVDVKELSRLW